MSTRNDCRRSTDEDCAMYLRTWFPLGWSDASCTIDGWSKCLCRFGGSPSNTYQDSKANLNANANDYSGCVEVDDDYDDDDSIASNVCKTAGFGAVDFTPYQLAYPDTQCRDIPADQVKWAYCCCGFPQYCCPSGDADCMDGVLNDDTLPEVPPAGNCPAPFEGPSDDACFYISSDPHTFVDCEDLVCEPLGGTLASIRSQEEEAYLERAIGVGGAYIGGFEAGYDESGNWRWVDSGRIAYGYSHWAPGEPNNYCVDEDCIIFAPYYFDGWIDASCTIDEEVTCICRYGGYPSTYFEVARDNLNSASNDYDCNDDGDSNNDDDNAGADYCSKHGYDAAYFTPFVQAYPAENPSRPQVSKGGYYEGSCGFAAAEDDAQWAQCCCSDSTYCCPDGAGVSSCKSSTTYNPDCPRGWDSPGSGFGCFKLTSDASTFTGCQHMCADEGGNLASIRSSEEMIFVRDMLERESASAYIGLFEFGEDESGDWRWVDGSVLKYYGWALGEPNNWCMDEDCAIFASNLNWMDVSCVLYARCVCRYGEGPTLARNRPDYFRRQGQRGV